MCKLAFIKETHECTHMNTMYTEREISVQCVCD